MTSGRTGASRESVDPSVREILRLKHACGASDRAIARSLSLVGSTVGLTRSGPRRRTCVGRWNLAAIATAASASRTAPWEGRPAPTTRQAHPAGESMFVDHAGQTVDLLDGSAGEIRPAQIFVAVTDASNYAYAEATPTQGLPDRVGAHVPALAFVGGVPLQPVLTPRRSGSIAPTGTSPASTDPGRQDAPDRGAQRATRAAAQSAHQPGRHAARPRPLAGPLRVEASRPI